MAYLNAIFLNRARIVLLAAALFSLTGCGSSSSPAPATGGDAGATAVSYNGPGSRWDVDLDDGAFTITRRETVSSPIDLTVTGTYEELPTGFVKLDVDASEGLDGPEPGEMAWALEVPGYAFFLKPMEAGNERIMAMVTAGECPTADVDANWVLVKKGSADNADDAGRDFFGSFNYDATTGTAMLPGRWSLAGDFADQGANDNIGSGTCADGIMEVTDETDNAVMYLTASGGAIVHTNVDNEYDSSFIFALAQTDIPGMTAMDGDYAGVLFDESLNSGEKVAPLAVACVSGMCSGEILADVETGAVDEGSATIDLSGTMNFPEPGFITGSITEDGTGNLACMVDTNAADTGRTIMSCVGQSPGDAAKMFNVILVSR